MNAMRTMMEEMLAQKKVQEEQSVSQPEKVTHAGDQTIMQKLSRFKKFAPPPFQEAKTPMEAEDWLEKLKKILHLVQAEDNDRIMFVEFLFKREASNWWKIEKRRLEKNKVTWENFQRMFLRHYFPQSVSE